MSLNQVPGTQIQGVNTRGIEINKDFVSIHIDWIDPVSKQYFDPTTYAVTVTKDAAPYAINHVVTPLSRKDDSPGVWVYEFTTQGFETGAYVFSFTGSTPDISTVTRTVTFTAADTPVEKYFIDALRTKLWDKRASRYLVDDNMRTRWTNGELYSFLDNAKQQVAQTPPAPTQITWEQAYGECHDLVLTGGFIAALEAAGIFETWNKFGYSDEVSLNIDRSVFFQNAQSLKSQWMQAVMGWKRDYTFHRVRAIGMGSGRFPLYYTRVLSLSVNNAQNVFMG